MTEHVSHEQEGDVQEPAARWEILRKRLDGLGGREPE